MTLLSTTGLVVFAVLVILISAAATGLMGTPLIDQSSLPDPVQSKDVDPVPFLVEPPPLISEPVGIFQRIVCPAPAESKFLFFIETTLNTNCSLVAVNVNEGFVVFPASPAYVPNGVI